MDGKFPGHADLVSGAARLVIVGSALAIGVGLASDRPVDWVDRILFSEDHPEYDNQHASEQGNHPLQDVEHNLVVHRRSSLATL
jgi:hypothetical protein